MASRPKGGICSCLWRLPAVYAAYGTPAVRRRDCCPDSCCCTCRQTVMAAGPAVFLLGLTILFMGLFVLPWGCCRCDWIASAPYKKCESMSFFGNRTAQPPCAPTPAPAVSTHLLVETLIAVCLVPVRVCSSVLAGYCEGVSGECPFESCCVTRSSLTNPPVLTHTCELPTGGGSVCELAIMTWEMGAWVTVAGIGCLMWTAHRIGAFECCECACACCGGCCLCKCCPPPPMPGTAAFAADETDCTRCRGCCGWCCCKASAADSADPNAPAGEGGNVSGSSAGAGAAIAMAPAREHIAGAAGASDRERGRYAQLGHASS
jgi:hypothetical protein